MGDSGLLEGLCAEVAVFCSCLPTGGADPPHVLDQLVAGGHDLGSIEGKFLAGCSYWIQIVDDVLFPAIHSHFGWLKISCSYFFIIRFQSFLVSCCFLPWPALTLPHVLPGSLVSCSNLVLSHVLRCLAGVDPTCRHRCWRIGGADSQQWNVQIYLVG